VSLRTPITLLVLLGVVVGAGWYGWTQVQEPLRNPFANDSDDCVTRTFEEGARLRTSQVVVNVYNAGSRDALASTTMDALVRRGFRRGVATNAPRRVAVADIAVVDGDPGSAAARLLRAQFRGPVPVQRRPDLTKTGLDVIVGNGYAGLSQKAPRSVLVRGDTDVCIPPEAGADEVG
jgi:LytR cell envelope-related transcriptional attenuator